MKIKNVNKPVENKTKEFKDYKQDTNRNKIMKKFIFKRYCTSDEALRLSLLIGYRKGNKLTIFKGSDKVMGCRVNEKDETDVYKWAKKHRLLDKNNITTVDVIASGEDLPKPILVG